MADTKEKMETTPEIFALVKKWLDDGKQVHSLICQDLGCLTNYFTTNKKAGCPNHAWHCPGTIERENLKVEDFDVAPVVYKLVKLKDLVIYYRESNQYSIVLEIPGYWRPIKVQSFGYLCEMDRESYRSVRREFGHRRPTHWLSEAEENGSLEEILNQYGYTLKKVT